MEDFERKLRRAAVKRRAQNASTFKTVCAPIDAARKQKRVAVRRKKLESLGIKTKVCSICGSDDVSTFEFDHFAGNKHHDQEWPKRGCRRRNRGSIGRADRASRRPAVGSTLAPS
jgi:hypothetical protein